MNKLVLLLESEKSKNCNSLSIVSLIGVSLSYKSSNNKSWKSSKLKYVDNFIFLKVIVFSVSLTWIAVSYNKYSI